MSDLDELARAVRSRNVRPPPLPPLQSPAAWPAVVGVVAAFLILGVVCLVVAEWGGTAALPNAPPDESRPQAPSAGAPQIDGPLSISAVSLSRIYRENEANGDLQFKEQELSVSGEMIDVRKDFLGHPIVALGEGPFSRVNCFFAKGEDAMLAPIRRGQRLQIRGRCKGMTFGTVMLDDCSVQ